jgi:hypothetical protein
MLQRSALASLCFIGLAALGCSKETTSSSNIKTGGIAALIDVYADDDTTATVHVELRVGGSSSNTYVALEGGDSLSATAAGKTHTLTSVDTGVYEADFSGVEGGTEFQITLDRPDDETASDNSGILPEPFTLDEPPSDLSRSADDLPLSWAPADTGDGMRVEIDGDCIFLYKHSMSDTGSYTVAAGELDSTVDEDDPKTDVDERETCDLTAKVERASEGSADTLFDPESYFKLHQRRSARFTSNF